ncbi:hypothetical protein COBT_002077, partial [Conglomerata obtusa]
MQFLFWSSIKCTKRKLEGTEGIQDCNMGKRRFNIQPTHNSITKKDFEWKQVKLNRAFEYECASENIVSNNECSNNVYIENGSLSANIIYNEQNQNINHIATYTHLNNQEIAQMSMHNTKILNQYQQTHIVDYQNLKQTSDDHQNEVYKDFDFTNAQNLVNMSDTLNELGKVDQKHLNCKQNECNRPDINIIDPNIQLTDDEIITEILEMLDNQKEEYSYVATEKPDNTKDGFIQPNDQITITPGHEITDIYFNTGEDDRFLDYNLVDVMTIVDSINMISEMGKEKSLQDFNSRGLLSSSEDKSSINEASSIGGLMSNELYNSSVQNNTTEFDMINFGNLYGINHFPYSSTTPIATVKNIIELKDQYVGEQTNTERLRAPIKIPTNKKDDGLNPLYIWYTLFASEEDKNCFLQVENHSDHLLFVFIRFEQKIINCLFDQENLKQIMYIISFSKAKEHVDAFFEMSKNKTNIINAMNRQNCEIANKVDLINACDYYMRLPNKNSEFNEEIKNLFTIVSKNLRNITICKYFKFVNLQITANVQIGTDTFLPYKVQSSCYKGFLIACLNDAKTSFKNIFPEIIGLIDYLEKSVTTEINEFNYKEVYVYIFNLLVLKKFSEISWDDIYKNQPNDKFLRNENTCIFEQSRNFSIIKYEIFKVLLYCIAPFITKERYETCALVRILENFVLCILVKPNTQRYNKKDSVFYVGKFNFIARFIFLIDCDCRHLFIRRTNSCNLINIIHFVFSNLKMSCMKVSLTTLAKSKIFLKFLRCYAKILEEKKILFDFLTELKKPVFKNFYHLNDMIDNPMPIKEYIKLNLDIDDSVKALRLD